MKEVLKRGRELKRWACITGPVICVFYVLTADFCPWGEIPRCQVFFSSLEVAPRSSDPGWFRPFASTNKTCRSWSTYPASSAPSLTGVLSVHVGYCGDEDKTDFKSACVGVLDLTRGHVATYDLTSGLWCIQCLDNYGCIVKVTQPCPTLCDPMDSAVHRILQPEYWSG